MFKSSSISSMKEEKLFERQMTGFEQGSTRFFILSFMKGVENLVGDICKRKNKGIKLFA